MNEIDTLAGQMLPAISAAVGAYGVGVLTRAEDGAADATVRLGQRLLALLFRRGANRAVVEPAVSQLVEKPEDSGVLAGLRYRIAALLAEDPALSGEVAALLRQQSGASASGDRSVALEGDNHGIVSTGEDAKNIVLR